MNSHLREKDEILTLNYSTKSSIGISKIELKEKMKMDKYNLQLRLPLL